MDGEAKARTEWAENRATFGSESRCDAHSSDERPRCEGECPMEHGTVCSNRNPSSRRLDDLDDIALQVGDPVDEVFR